jgi:hypothetical protein
MSVTDRGLETRAVVSNEGSRPIGDYGLVADCNSAGLVDRDGSIGWLCLPRYDSPAVFAQILDRDGGALADPPVRRVSPRAALPAGNVGAGDDVRHRGGGCCR